MKDRTARRPGSLKTVLARNSFEGTLHRLGNQQFSSPRAAVDAMRSAGAIFTITPREDGLIGFTYTIEPGGDLDRCRSILVAVKSRPASFYTAFQAELAFGNAGGQS